MGTAYVARRRTFDETLLVTELGDLDALLERQAVEFLRGPIGGGGPALCGSGYRRHCGISGWWWDGFER